MVTCESCGVSWFCRSYDSHDLSTFNFNVNKLHFSPRSRDKWLFKKLGGFSGGKLFRSTSPMKSDWTKAEEMWDSYRHKIFSCCKKRSRSRALFFFVWDRINGNLSARLKRNVSHVQQRSSLPHISSTSTGWEKWVQSRNSKNDPPRQRTRICSFAIQTLI